MVIWWRTVLLRIFVPRRLRRVFLVFREARWLVPAWRCLALPLAVRRNRFLVPLWVFCFGISGARYWQMSLAAGHLAADFSERKALQYRGFRRFRKGHSVAASICRRRPTRPKKRLFRHRRQNR